MIHYTCDMCGRPLSPDERRYVVEAQVYEAREPASECVDADTDHLEELDDLIELGGADDEPLDDTTKLMRMDLCPCCHKKFVKNPLGRESLANQLDFSDN